MIIQRIGDELNLHMVTGDTIMIRSSRTGEVNRYRLKGVCKKMDQGLETGLVIDLEKIEELP